HTGPPRELVKNGGPPQNRRPRGAVPFDLFDARLPMPQLIEPAIEKHGRQTQPGNQESILGQFCSLLRAALRCLTAGSPSASKLCPASCRTRSALVTR